MSAYTHPVDATPLSYFHALVAQHPVPLFEAAVCIAQLELPTLDAQATLNDVDRMAAKLRSRLPADASASHKLRLLSSYFHGELGFAANVNNFYASDNSFIHRVLQTRRGIPISLGVILLELAEQIGLQAQGVPFPGHFLLRFRTGGSELVVDPLTGDALLPSRLDDMLQAYRPGSTAAHDAGLPPMQRFLRQGSAREILARMLRNLREVYRASSDWPLLLEVQQRLVILLPDDARELRDRGLALEALGQGAAAAQDLRDYVARQPNAADAELLRQRLQQQSERGSPPSP